MPYFFFCSWFLFSCRDQFWLYQLLFMPKKEVPQLLMTSWSSFVVKGYIVFVWDVLMICMDIAVRFLD